MEGKIRDGISVICKGYAEGSNKLLKSYNTNKPTSYIVYLNANDLYGHSMMQLLPTKILDWVNPKDFSLHNYSSNSPIGSSIEFDLDYPDEFHDLHFILSFSR